MNLRIALTFAIVLLGSVALHAGEPPAPQPPPAPATTPAATLEQNIHRLKTGYFPVTLQSSGGNLALLKESDIDSRLCTAAPSADRIATFQKEGLPIYVYVFDGDGTLMLPDFWKGPRETFMKDRTVANLKRQPSLFDPAVRKALHERVRLFAENYKTCDVLAMCVAHEASVTGFSAPLDFDYSDASLQAFRAWLKNRYATIEDLNKTWGMSFKDFDAVTPPITDAMLTRELPHYPAMNLAPWFEFREFTDDSFVDLVHELAADVRATAPAIPTSVTVTAPPCAYGGWDYARLLQPGKIDALETYPFPGDKGLIRGLTAGATVNVCSFYAGNAAMQNQAWRNFLGGERCNFLDAKTSQLFPDKDKLGGLSAQLKPEFDAMRSAAKLIGEADIEDGGVRMIYSQPSVRCSWFIDNKPDGATYPNRGSKYEIDHNTYIQALGGWQNLLGELAIHPLFESYLDLRAGKFRHGLPKVLIANQLCCVSDEELAFLKKYVEQGGTLVVDDSFALFDSHGNARSDPQIPLTAWKREKLRATFGQVDVENSAAGETDTLAVGKGGVVRLNATVVRYAESAKPDAKTHLKLQVARLIGAQTILADGDVPACDVDVYRYERAGKHWIGVCSTKPDDTRLLQLATLQPDGKAAPQKTAAGDPITFQLVKNRALVQEINPDAIK